MRRDVADAWSGESRTGATRRDRRSVRLPALLATSFLLAVTLLACAPQINRRGHQFTDNDLQQLQPGMSQEQVRMALGSPATTASVPGGNAYYYISSTTRQTAFLPEKEVDRQVVAVYFTPQGSVERVAHYGLKDGKVFDFISRTTPAPGGREDGILKQLFRNLGQKQLFGD
jgi:outer membrane protein assembly factor BamE (lipoprotein component of BamABCDE complex)